MKKIKYAIILCMTLIMFLSITAYAHPGRTDSNGGHYNRSDGTYHYHHGYPEHQHINGECPYDFHNKTGSNSGSGASQRNNNAVASTPKQTEASKDTQKDNDDWTDFGILCIIAFPFILSYIDTISSNKDNKSRKK